MASTPSIRELVGQSAAFFWTVILPIHSPESWSAKFAYTSTVVFAVFCIFSDVYFRDNDHDGRQRHRRMPIYLFIGLAAISHPLCELVVAAVSGAISLSAFAKRALYLLWVMGVVYTYCRGYLGFLLQRFERAVIHDTTRRDPHPDLVDMQLASEVRKAQAAQVSSKSEQ